MVIDSSWEFCAQLPVSPQCPDIGVGSTLGEVSGVGRPSYSVYVCTVVGLFQVRVGHACTVACRGLIFAFSLLVCRMCKGGPSIDTHRMLFFCLYMCTVGLSVAHTDHFFLLVSRLLAICPVCFSFVLLASPN